MISYIGSKSTLSDFIIPHIPKDILIYVEPFGGSMGIYFSLNLKEYPNTRFIYNDMNPLNCNLFEQLKREKFIKKVISTKVDNDFYQNCFQNLTSKSKEIKALSWLVILSCGDKKDLISKTWRGNLSFEQLKYKLPKYTEYFNRLEIENLDYKKVFEKYDSETSFFYCDPPYKGYEDYYINIDWVDDSHIELRDKLFNLSAKWVLSYYNFEEMEDWYKDYSIISKSNNLGIEYLIY